MLRFPIHEQNVFLHSLRGPFIGSRSVGHTVLHLFHQIDTEVFRFLSTRKWCRIFHFGVRVFVASSLKYDWVSCIYFVSRNLAKLICWSRDVFSVDSSGVLPLDFFLSIVHAFHVRLPPCSPVRVPRHWGEWGRRQGTPSPCPWAREESVRSATKSPRSATGLLPLSNRDSVPDSLVASSETGVEFCHMLSPASIDTIAWFLFSGLLYAVGDID